MDKQNLTYEVTWNISCVHVLYTSSLTADAPKVKVYWLSTGAVLDSRLWERVCPVRFLFFPPPFLLENAQIWTWHRPRLFSSITSSIYWRVAFHFDANVIYSRESVVTSARKEIDGAFSPDLNLILIYQNSCAEGLSLIYSGVFVFCLLRSTTGHLTFIFIMKREPR
jgi:hypothetical protein